MPLVDEQEVGHGVIRNKDVHPTVVIHVCRDGAKGFTGMIGYPGFFTDIGESAVPVVVKQIAGPGLVMARNAVVTPVDIISAQYVQRFVIVDKAGNKQVQFAVVVVIKPDRTSGPTYHAGTRLFCDIGKGRISVVTIQNVAPVTGNVKINPPIGVIVCSRDAHPEGAAGYTCFVSDIRERAVMIVTIERVSEWRCGFEEI